MIFQKILFSKMSLNNLMQMAREPSTWILITIFSTFFFLKHSDHYASLLLAPSLVLLFIDRKAIPTVNKEMKYFFIFFFLYLVTFTVISDYPRSSVKGLYDIFRGLWFFPLGLLFFHHYKKSQHLSTIFLIAILLILLGNFFIDHKGYGGFYGYDKNSNNVAIECFYFLLLALAIFQFSKLNTALIIAISCVSISLILFANSRGVIIGLSAGLIVSIIAKFRLRWPTIVVTTITVISTVTYLLNFNVKGFNNNARAEMWSKIYHHMNSNDFWLGHGINTYSNATHDFKIFSAGFPHNIFMEVWISTGTLGLLIFTVLGIFLLSILVNAKYEKTLLFYISIGGLISLMTMSLFDLKFASFSNTAMIMLFMASLVSTQRRNEMPQSTNSN